MDKLLFSALINELNNEMLFITYNYQSEFLTREKINKLGDDDYKNLNTSKYLKGISAKLLDYSPEVGDYLNEDLLKIIETGIYNKSNLLYFYDELTPYFEYYVSSLDKFSSLISSTLDTKRLSDGFTGSFPIYMKLEENRLTLERCYTGTNSKSILDKNSKTFGFNVSFIDYDIKLNDYTLDGINLKDKSIKEIIEYVEKSAKFDMNNSKYYQTEIIEYRENMEYSIGELSFFLDKRRKTFDGIKNAFKGSFKGVLISIIIFVLFLTAYFLYRYFTRR